MKRIVESEEKETLSLYELGSLLRKARTAKEKASGDMYAEVSVSNCYCGGGFEWMVSYSGSDEGMPPLYYLTFLYEDDDFDGDTYTGINLRETILEAFKDMGYMSELKENGYPSNLKIYVPVSEIHKLEDIANGQGFLFEKRNMKENRSSRTLNEEDMMPELKYREALGAAAEELGCRFEDSWYGVGLEGKEGDLGWAFCMKSTPAYGLETYFVARKGGSVSVMNASAAKGTEKVHNPENSIEGIVSFVKEHIEDQLTEKNTAIDILKGLEAKLKELGVHEEMYFNGECLELYCDPTAEDDVYDVYADYRDSIEPEHCVDYKIARGDMEEDGTDEIRYRFIVEY